MSAENEMSVLGAICLDENAFDVVSDILTADDFSGRFKPIYRAIASICSAGVIPDVVSLSDQLQKTNELARVGGVNFLASLIDYTPTAANVKYYASKVRDASISRQVKDFANSILTFKGSTDNLIKLVEDNAFNFNRQENTEPRHITEGIKAASKNMEEATKNKGQVTGLKSGLNGLDFLLNGFRPGKVYYVAARPSMGKTALAVDILRNNKDVTSLLVSMEMESDELAQRAICSEARVDGGRAQLGLFNDSDWSKMASAIGKLCSSKIWIQDQAVQSVASLYSTSRKWKRKHDLGLLVVDYLQLLEGDGTDFDIISKASKMFKRIAKELKIPVIVLSQLNRELEKREDKKPRMSDLRGSGQIEQDADVILFPYREAVYCECKGMNDSCGKGHQKDAQIIIGKHRGGKIGMVKALYYGEYTSFYNAD